MRRFKVGDRVVAREDGEHGRVEEVIEDKPTFGVYSVQDDNGNTWVAFDDDIYPE